MYIGKEYIETLVGIVTDRSIFVMITVHQWAATHVADFVRQLPNCSFAQQLVRHKVSLYADAPV